MKNLLRGFLGKVKKVYPEMKKAIKSAFIIDSGVGCRQKGSLCSLAGPFCAAFTVVKCQNSSLREVPESGLVTTPGWCQFSTSKTRLGPIFNLQDPAGANSQATLKIDF
jgi:hypothetical protein